MPATYSEQQNDVPKLPAGAALFAAAAVGTFTVADYPQGVSITTTSAGNLTVVEILSATSIALTGLPAYYTLPFRVRSVTAGGTAAYLASF